MRTIILACAHGEGVQGKQSPDGIHKEYLWSRKIQYAIADKLAKNNIPHVIVPTRGDMSEIGLNVRPIRYSNVIAPAFVFSLHNNAAGLGNKWMSARGVEIWTSKGKTFSDALATRIYERLQKEFPNLHGDFPIKLFWRKDTISDGDVDKEANFAELMSIHPSVLLEWLFQDNKLDLELLQDDEINTILVDVLSDELMAISLTT